MARKTKQEKQTETHGQLRAVVKDVFAIRDKEGKGISAAIVAARNRSGLTGDAGTHMNRMLADVSRGLQSGRTDDEVMESAETIIARYGADVTEEAAETPVE